MGSHAIPWPGDVPTQAPLRWAEGALPPVHRDTHVIRVVVLGWCLWLIGSWLVALWNGSAIPASQWMLILTTVGFTGVWPIVRLSLDAPRALPPEKVVVMEWVALAGILQTVVWPLALTARWGAAQPFWLDRAILAWSLLSSAIVVLALRAGHALHRAAAAVLCMLVLFAEPLVLAVVGGPGPRTDAMVMRISPLQTLWALSEEGRGWAAAPWRANVLAAGVAAVLAWGSVRVTGWRAKTSDIQEESP